VVISDDELKEAAPEKSVAIEIQEFVNESQIPTLYFEKPYYLEPDKGPGKTYALLREALAKSGKVGVAQFVLRNRESLCVLKAQGNALTLNTLRFASEIRSADELRLPVNEKLGPERSQSCPEADRGHDSRIRSRQISRHWANEVEFLPGVNDAGFSMAATI
jgi:DNA end-binding protein Ku